MTELAIGKPLPNEALDAVVYDRRGERTSLSAHLGSGAAVVVFMRHFGCVGCSSQVDDIAPIIPQLETMGVTVVFVGNGNPEYIDDFIQRHRLEGYSVTILTDPTLKLYARFGFERSKSRTLGAKAIYHELLLIARGYFPRGVRGDPFQQGGIVVLDTHQRVAAHVKSRLATDPVGASAIANIVLEITAERARAHGEVA